MHNSTIIFGDKYTCTAILIIIRIDEFTNLVGVSQNHLAGKRNQDVKSLGLVAVP